MSAQLDQTCLLSFNICVTMSECHNFKGKNNDKRSAIGKLIISVHLVDCGVKILKEVIAPCQQ